MITHDRISNGSARRIGDDTQRGAVLVMGLVVLLVLTILGMTTLRTSSMQQLMSGNVQEATRAFVASESGLDWPFILDTEGNPVNYQRIAFDSSDAFINLPPFGPTGVADQTDLFSASATLFRSVRLQTTDNRSFRSPVASGSSTDYAYLDEVVVGRSGALAVPTAQDVKQQTIRQKSPSSGRGGEVLNSPDAS